MIVDASRIAVLRTQGRSWSEVQYELGVSKVTGQRALQARLGSKQLFLLWNLCQQFSRFYHKGARQLDDIDKTNVALASFHSSNVIPMEMGPIGEILLSKPMLAPELTNAIPKKYPWIGGSCHRLIICS